MTLLDKSGQVTTRWENLGLTWKSKDNLRQENSRQKRLIRTGEAKLGKVRTAHAEFNQSLQKLDSAGLANTSLN